MNVVLQVVGVVVVQDMSDVTDIFVMRLATNTKNSFVVNEDIKA